MASKRFWAGTVDILQVVVLAFGMYLIMQEFLIRPHQVYGESMLPNLHDREQIFTDRLSYLLGKLKRGDVVVFKSPRSPDDYIKRIVGMPGDVVTIQENKVYVNGKLLMEDYLPQDLPTPPGSFATEGEAIKLEGDQYFVLGDNRGNSSDSRSWGPIKNDKIVGRAWIVYLPLGSFRVVK